TDARGGSATQSFTIAVIAQDVNHPPVITSQPRTAATVGHSYRYDAMADDPDGDPVLWALVSGASGMSIDASLGTLRWTPTAAQPGPQDVPIVAEDSLSAATTQHFTIMVRSVDVPPVITSNSVTTAAAGVAYTYTVAATDAENDPLTFALSTAPGGMTIDASS